jgi:MoaA/NifB/PqqE/SkfB family radical SAM enzyme
MELQEYIKTCERSVISTWAEGSFQVKAPPWLVYISTTNYCNSHCQVCAHNQAMRKEKGHMSFETFRCIVDQLPEGVRKIYLMKQGEPFLNKNLELFIEYLRHKKPEVYIAFHTNGILAKKDRVKKILPLINTLGISISAVTPEVYRDVHGVDKFDTVIQNIGYISELLMNVANTKKPHVFIDYVYQQANATEKEKEVVQYFFSHFPGLSSVDFHWVYNYQGRTKEGNLTIYDELEYDKFPYCVFPWSSVTFCHDGKASYCFQEPQENRFLGDITQQSFKDIWNGEEYQRFRSHMVNKRFDMLAEDGFFCHKCSYLWCMRSQSPRNLNGGYSAQAKSQTQKLQFGDLLDMSQKKLFVLGTEYYLKGEIHQAIGCFHVLLGTHKNEVLLKASQTMLRKCQQVLQKYKNLSLWQEMLNKEGCSLDQRQCRYYSISWLEKEKELS